MKRHMPAPILLRPIEELEIAARTADLLKAESIYYIGDLAQRTETELLRRLDNSKTTVLEIRQALRARGLDLRGG